MGLLERELKFRVADEHVFHRLLGQLGEPERTALQVNLYLDTPRCDVARSRSMVRVRSEGERHVLTYKHEIGRTEGYFECEEHEVEVPPAWVQQLQEGGFPPGLWELEPLQRLRRRLGPCSLEVLGSVVNLRRSFQHPQGEVVELDRTEFSDGSVDHELEVETERPEILRAWVEELFERASARAEPQPHTKYRRFLDRVLPGRPA